LASVLYRSRKRLWRPDLPRSRQRLWWRSLHRMIKLILGLNTNVSGIEGFLELFSHNLIPVTRAGQKENQTMN
jgi:hypothetical protein